MVLIDPTIIQAFWDWFISVSCELSSSHIRPSILEELDNRVLSFDGLTWELGPGTTRENMFVISPNGRKNLMDLSKHIIGASPQLPDWEFHHAKPPKKWDLQFVIHDSCGSSINVDARDWQYVLLRFPDGMFEIILRVCGLPDNDSIRFRAADIVVEGQLGEEAMLEFVNNIDIVDEFEIGMSDKASNIRNLADHLVKLV